MCVCVCVCVCVCARVCVRMRTHAVASQYPSFSVKCVDSGLEKPDKQGDSLAISQMLDHR